MINKLQIRSFVKGGNHGQYLQALGLYEFLRSEFPELEVSHLNYNNHVFKEIKIQLTGGHLPKYISMMYFWLKRMKFTNLNYRPDVSVYGSDMIWHQGSSLFPPDPIFFGENDSAKVKISYAPSVASRTKKECDWIGKCLQKFKSISVRDKNTKEFVYEHTKRNATYVIDPCFLLIGSKYNRLIHSKDRLNFMSVYSATPKKVVNSFKKNIDMTKVPEFCKNVDVTGYFQRSDIFKQLTKQLKDPLWTVKRISESKLLLTSTFHGVMMALMTKTPFIAVSSPNLDARLQNPISNCFGSFRLISLGELESLNEKTLQDYLTDTDLDQVKLIEYITQSKQWLKESINEAL